MTEARDTRGVWEVHVDVQDGAPSLILEVGTVEDLVDLYRQMTGPNGITVSTPDPIEDGADMWLWVCPGGLDSIRVPAVVLMCMGEQSLLEVDIMHPVSAAGWRRLVDELGLDPEPPREPAPAVVAPPPEPILLEPSLLVNADELAPIDGAEMSDDFVFGADPEDEASTVSSVAEQAAPLAKPGPGWPQAIDANTGGAAGPAAKAAAAPAGKVAEAAPSASQAEPPPVAESSKTPDASAPSPRARERFTSRVHRTSELKAIPIRKRREVSRVRSVRKSADTVDAPAVAPAGTAPGPATVVLPPASAAPSPGPEPPTATPTEPPAARLPEPEDIQFGAEEPLAKSAPSPGADSSSSVSTAAAAVRLGPASLGSFPSVVAPSWLDDREDPLSMMGGAGSQDAASAAEGGAERRPPPPRPSGPHAPAPPPPMSRSRGRLRAPPPPRRSGAIRGPVETEELRPADPAPAIPTARYVRPPHDSQRAVVLASSSATQTLWKGSLAQRSAAHWLLMASGRGGAGICTVQADGKAFHLLLENGAPTDIQVVPQTATYSLATVVAQSGSLEAAQVAQVNELARTHGVDLGDALITAGLLDEPAVARLRKTRLGFLLKKMLEATNGAFFYTPLQYAPYSTDVEMPSVVKAAWRVVSKRLRQFNPAELGERRDKYRNDYPVRVEETPWPIESVPMDSRERRFYELSLEGGRRLWEVMTVSNLNKTQSTVVILSLLELGYLRFESELDRTHHDDEIVEALNQRAALIDRESDFELLHCHWSAYRVPIEQGYRRAINELGDDNYSPRVLERVRESLETLRGEVQRAYDHIQDDARRRAYRATVADKLMIVNSADLFLKQADMCMMRDEIDTVIDYYHRVIELDPGNVTARTGLAKLRKRR